MKHKRELMSIRHELNKMIFVQFLSFYFCFNFPYQINYPTFIILFSKHNCRQVNVKNLMLQVIINRLKRRVMILGFHKKVYK